MDVVSYVLAKSYVNQTIAGMGALQGAPCQIIGITPVTGGNEIQFRWEDRTGTAHTTSLTVKDGAQGVSVVGMNISGGHLIGQLSDGTTVDAGPIPTAAGGLNTQVVTSLPAVAAADPNTLYLTLVSGNDYKVSLVKDGVWISFGGGSAADIALIQSEIANQVGQISNADISLLF